MYHGKVIESGTVEDIFRDPRHPYLKALMRAVPRFNMAPGRAADADPRGACVDRPPAVRARPHAGAEAVIGEPLLEVRNLVKRFDDAQDLAARAQAGRRGARGRRRQLPCRRRRMPGPGRRVRLRQDHHREDADALAHARQRRNRVQRLRHAGATCWRCKGEELFAYRRKVQFVFQDPFSSLNPRMTVYDILTEPLVIHGIGDEEERFVRGQGADDAGRARRALPAALSAQLLRRPAPAHRHRARAGARSATADLRRAGVGARRVGPGAGAQPAAGPAGARSASPTSSSRTTSRWSTTSPTASR